MNPVFQQQWIWVVLPLVALLGAWLAWRSAPGKTRRLRLTMAMLRAAALLIAGFVLLNPGSWKNEREESEGTWAIMLDRSASMAMADSGTDKKRTRWESALELAESAIAISGDAPSPRIFTYDGSLNQVSAGDRERSLDSLAAEVPDGKGSDLPAAGRALLDQLGAGGALSGILVVGDGRHVGGKDADVFSGRARAAGTKLVVVPLGGEVAERDLTVRAARRQYVAFPGQMLRVVAEVSAEGLGSVRPEVTVSDASGSALGSSEIDLEAVGASGKAAAQIVQFEIEAGEAGYHRYQFSAPVIEGERHSYNNTAEFGVNVIDGKIGIFTAEGVPYWDSKFLIQLLRGRPNISTTSVYRLSSDRYFQVETDASEATESENSIFPENLADYDLLVFGKGCEYFLDPSRVSRLKTFIRDDGGALIFARGKPYAGTFPELEALEPVEWGEPLGEGFRFAPTSAGVDAGLFGGHLAEPESDLWGTLPHLIDARRPRRLKAFAQVLAEGVFEAAGKERSVPVIISRRFGRGTVTTVNADGLWKWDFIPGDSRAQNMYAELWEAMVLWSVTHSEFLPGQDFSLRLSESVVDLGTPVRATVAARDFNRDESPIVVLTGAEGADSELSLRPDTTTGRWSTVFTPNSHGEYQISLEGTGVTTPLSVRPPPAESDILSADPDSMKALAEAAGGRMVSADELDGAIAELLPTTRVVERANAVWEPAWDRLIWLLPLLGILIVEWFIRRRNGLL